MVMIIQREREQQTEAFVSSTRRCFMSWFPPLHLAWICTLTYECVLMLINSWKVAPTAKSLMSAKKQCNIIKPKKACVASNKLIDTEGPGAEHCIPTVSVLVHANTLHWVGLYLSRATKKVGHYFVSLPFFPHYAPPKAYTRHFIEYARLQGIYWCQVKALTDRSQTNSSTRWHILLFNHLDLTSILICTSIQSI